MNQTRMSSEFAPAHSASARAGICTDEQIGAPAQAITRRRRVAGINDKSIAETRRQRLARESAGTPTTSNARSARVRSDLAPARRKQDQVSEASSRQPMCREWRRDADGDVPDRRRMDADRIRLGPQSRRAERKTGHRSPAPRPRSGSAMGSRIRLCGAIDARNRARTTNRFAWLDTGPPSAIAGDPRGRHATSKRPSWTARSRM